jgi:hypothetical protein
MTCRTLVHELGREQPKTTKELLNITTRHAFGEEVVGAAFVLDNAEAAANGGRAVPTKATSKGAHLSHNTRLRNVNGQACPSKNNILHVKLGDTGTHVTPRF